MTVAGKGLVKPIIYRDDAIWSPRLLPGQQQGPALLPLLHGEVIQVGRRSLQSPDVHPWTGHAA